MQLEIISREPEAGARQAPLLFVHGAWHAAWCWAEHFLGYFAQQGYPAHAVSLRGHGGSEGRSRLRWTRVARYVDDLTQVAGELPRRPVLIGHSMGGALVQKYLETHVAPAAVLLASMPPSGALPATLRLFQRHPLAVMRASLTLSLFPVVATPQLAREALFSPGLPEETVQAYAARLQEESYLAFLDMLALDLPRARCVKTPMLVMGGARDGFYRVSEIEATARAYGTEAVIAADTAHDMMLDVGWRDVADRILAWLRGRGL